MARNDAALVPTGSGDPRFAWRRRDRAKLEDAFAFYWDKVIAGPPLVRDHAFHAGRRWRFDFAHYEARVAVELHGGTFVAGRHSRGAGQSRDAERHNVAVHDGWAVYYITTDMLRRDPLRWCAMVRDAIAARGGGR